MDVHECTIEKSRAKTPLQSNVKRINSEPDWNLMKEKKNKSNQFHIRLEV